MQPCYLNFFIIQIWTSVSNRSQTGFEPELLASQIWLCELPNKHTFYKNT